MKKYILDSYAMIAYFEDESGANKVADILKRIVERKAKGFMSVINWGEVYYNTFREEGVEKAEKVLEQLNRYPIQIVVADKELTYIAAKFKATYRIAYADCFAAALSLRENATVVTGDPEFKIFSKEISIQWL